MTSRQRIAQVGYGEAGSIFAAALAKSGAASVAAYDVKIAGAAWAADAKRRATADGVELAADLAAATKGATLVISAVTAAAARTAAEAIASACDREAFVLDVNSASPRTKNACAEAVNRAGGRYVEAAIMTSVPPHGLRTPMLLGGPHAAAAQPFHAGLGFEAEVGAAGYGTVSAIKLCRSVFIKGMEALAVESLLTARLHGVEAEVLASLHETFPGMGWERQAGYFWKRVFQHGKRRSEEMREAAVTVRDAGLTPRMASSTADVQAWMAELRAAGVFEGLSEDSPWTALADRIAQKALDGGSSNK